MNVGLPLYKSSFKTDVNQFVTFYNLASQPGFTAGQIAQIVYGTIHRNVDRKSNTLHRNPISNTSEIHKLHSHNGNLFVE